MPAEACLAKQCGDSPSVQRLVASASALGDSQRVLNGIDKISNWSRVLDGDDFVFTMIVLNPSDKHGSTR